MFPTAAPFLSAFGAFAVAGLAQAQTPQLEVRKVEGAPGRVHYDLATSKITKLVRPRQVQVEQHTGAASTEVQRANVNTFRNTRSTGYFTTVVLGSEFIDWAAKDTGRSLVTAFTFAYGTVEFEPPYGGQGASLDLSFYSGTSGGNGICNLGTELGRFAFTGLPGATASLFQCVSVFYRVTSFLASPIQVPDGQIGWGYTGEDSDGMGGSNTGPEMTDFGTNTGWRDSFQWYADPASLNTCVGTFWFGGCSTGSVPPAGTGFTPCASFWMGLTEYAPGQSASCALLNTTNPVNLQVTSPPQIGGSFQASTTTPVAAFACSARSLPGVPISGLVNGVLLCDPTALLGNILFTTTGAVALPVPLDPGLEGMNLCFQAAELTGPRNFRLTNAFDCTLGG